MKQFLLYSIFFLSNVIQVFSFDFSLLNFAIDFNEEISIQNVRQRVNYVDQGDSYYFISSNKIIYKGIEIPFRIYALIDNKQIPFESESLKLLKAYYSDEDRYDVNTLFYNHKSYYEKYDYYNSFITKYKARDIQYIDGYESDVLYGQDGTKIERDYTFGVWESISAEDKLTYYFRSTKGLYSEYIIEVTNIWMKIGEFEDWREPVVENFDDDGKTFYIKELYTMTNEQLKNFPNQDDPSIRLMHLLNEAMTTFRFKDRPNIPDSNLGTATSDRVRVRSSYNLDSEVLGHVNTGEEVIVMERSPEKQAIGDMNDYWYRVLSKTSYIKGWMYGAFLDLQE